MRKIVHYVETASGRSKRVVALTLSIRPLEFEIENGQPLLLGRVGNSGTCQCRARTSWQHSYSQKCAFFKRFFACFLWVHALASADRSSSFEFDSSSATRAAHCFPIKRAGRCAHCLA